LKNACSCSSAVRKENINEEENKKIYSQIDKVGCYASPCPILQYVQCKTPVIWVGEVVE
jgi:hypothetical protein